MFSWLGKNLSTFMLALILAEMLPFQFWHLLVTLISGEALLVQPLLVPRLISVANLLLELMAFLTLLMPFWLEL